MDKAELVVIVGRFQIHELHEGHKSLIDQAIAKASKAVLILVGATSDNYTERNKALLVLTARVGGSLTVTDIFVLVQNLPKI